MKFDELLKEEERLWINHAWMTRQVTQDYVFKTGCLTTNLRVLYQNQEEIGANFAALSDNQSAGNKLANLLKKHVDVDVKIVKALSKGKDLSSLQEKAKEIASKIADVYHQGWKKINKNKMDRMMQMHVQLSLQEATAIVNKDCERAAIAGKRSLEHIYMMSDYVASTFKLKK